MGKNILVLGVTGQQGGAVARHLRRRGGFTIYGLTRDASKPSAQALQAQGVQIIEGDLDDRAALDAAVATMDGVYSVQNWMQPGGVERELEQGLRVAEAVNAAGVGHLVYGSVGGAERNTGIPHFESKWQIEQRIRALGIPATILRPAAFMDNYNWVRPQINDGTLALFAMDATKPLQLIAADDIGWFAALAFAQPERYIGQALEIAGDELTMPEQAAVLTQVLNRPVRYAPEQAALNDAEGQAMIDWFNRDGYHADIPALRALHPDLLTFDVWLRQTGWAAQ